MLKNCNWSEDRDYKSGSKEEPLQFYLDGLARSKEFNLLLGYFSSSAISLLSVGFATFISKGGKMNMVINQFLSQSDKDTINQVEDRPNEIPEFDLSNLAELQNNLDEYGVHFFQCLAYLIFIKRIQIKIIKPKNSDGIAHYKEGVFFDGENYVGYSGSCNFTYYGLAENREKLNIFLSWENGRSTKFINNQLALIESYFNEQDKDVEYLSSKDIEVAIASKFGNKDLNELLIEEKQLLKKKSILISNAKLQKTISKAIEEIDHIRNIPRFPYKAGPRQYQLDAYNKWVKNDRKGIFSMATGTGKTITSLNCLLNEYNKTLKYRAIIVVPTIALVDQWKKECQKFNFSNIISVSSKDNWEKNLAFFNTASKLIRTSYIVIVTYATLSRSKFKSYFAQLPDDTLFIADETHNLGSKSILNLLPKVHLEYRIGLSATPQRKFDEFGNESIEKFFKDKPPYIVSYTMEDALKIGWLCKYIYKPHVVRLTDLEMEKYKEISLQLLRMGLFDKATGTFNSSPEIEMKLLERKRIIHKAVNKLEVFKQIIKDEFIFRKNLKYTLIYVPEGIETSFESTDYTMETEDERRLIDEYTKVVSQIDESVMVQQFTSSSTNRDEILNNFERGNIHVLTSMKCLDEGIDIPRSELAIFCASTGNPRQFIQRRGRVLRLHKEKFYATIHDLVVIPEVTAQNTFDMERNLVKKEIERVVDFANLAINKSDSYEVFKYVLDYYNLNLNEL
jgi:superfamily II DNA or RNA helicase